MMKRLCVGMVTAAVIALCAVPAMAGSLRHGSGGGGGGGEESQNPDKKKWFEDSDGGAVGAVPEPTAGLVFAAGALVIASRLRKNRN